MIKLWSLTQIIEKENYLLWHSLDHGMVFWGIQKVANVLAFLHIFQT